MTIERTAHRLATGFSLLEAPRWHNGMLYTSDFFSHRVLQWDLLSGSTVPTTVCIVEGQPSGLGFMPDGRLRVVSMNGRQLLEWDGDSLSIVADFSDLVTGPGNDMAIDSVGNCIIGNFGLVPGTSVAAPTQLIRVSPDDVVSVAADDVLFPNGIVIDEARGRLLVSETYRCRVTEFDYEDGVLSHPRTWAKFSEDPGSYDIPAITPNISMVPDGMAMDSEGLLWVGDAKGHRAVRVAEGGEIVEAVDTGELSPYAVALGGEHGTTLLLCCAPPVETTDPAKVNLASLMACEVSIPG